MLRIPASCLPISTLLVLSLLVPAGSAAVEEAVVISLPHSEGIVLAAVYQRPAEGPIRHAVLVLPPAGPADPDLSLGPRGIYKAVADHLASAGVASLRISTRGMAGAGGSWLETDFDDRARDATAAFDWLAARPELAEATLVVGGTSEGGALALAVALERDRADGVFLLSTPMIDGRSAMKWQRSKLLATSQLTEEQKSLVVGESDRMLKGAASGAEDLVREVLSGPAGAMVLPAYGMVPSDLEQRIAFVIGPWYRSQVRYDVEPLVRAVRQPIFAAYGTLDWVIDGPENAELLRERVGEGAKLDLHVLDDRNHLMMPAVTGSPLEYGTLPEIIDVEVWDLVVAWIEGL